MSSRTAIAHEKQSLLVPFIWDSDLEDEELYDSYCSDSVYHPLKIGKSCIAYLYSALYENRLDHREKGLALLEILRNYPDKEENNKGDYYSYPLTYTLDSGVKWKSAQANSAIALAFLLGYEIFGDEAYRLKADKAMNVVISSYDVKGLKFEFNDSCSWYLTNIYDGLAQVDGANFLHNHQLLTLSALLYFDLSMPGKGYRKSFVEGVNAIDQLERFFLLSDSSWTIYQTNPKNLEPLHYAVYNVMILKSILKVNKDKRLQKILYVRENILKEKYSVYKNTDGLLVLNVIGGPTYFNNDIYSMNFDLFYGDKKVDEFKVDPIDFSLSQNERYFKIIERENLDSVALSISFGDHIMPLFKLPTQKVVNPYSGYVESVNALEPVGEILNQNKTKLTCNEGLNRLQMSYSFPRTINFYNSYLFGWWFKSNKDIVSIEVKMINSYNETSIFNYYKQPQEKKNLVLLKANSFIGYSDFKSKRIKKIIVSYYFDAEENEDFEVEFSDILWSNDPFILKEILEGEHGEYHLNENRNFGGLY